MTDTMPDAPSTPPDSREVVERFTNDLNQLYLEAGAPLLSELRKASGGQFSMTTVSDVLHGRRTRLPNWRFVAAFVTACRAMAEESGRDPDELGTIDDWQQRWGAATKAFLAARSRERGTRLAPSLTDLEIRDWVDYVVNAPTAPVTIYLSDESIHEQVEAAVSELLIAAGLDITDRDDPIIGSWFRKMQAALRSPVAREGALAAAHAVDSRLVLAQDAAITATMLQNLGPVIASLQPTKDAVLRVGALLIVKVDWAVNVFQLTAAQQATLDHRPQLDRSPHEIIAALNLAAPGHNEDDPLSLR